MEIFVEKSSKVCQKGNLVITFAQNNHTMRATIKIILSILLFSLPLSSMAGWHITKNEKESNDSISVYDNVYTESDIYAFVTSSNMDYIALHTESGIFDTINNQVDATITFFVLDEAVEKINVKLFVGSTDYQTAITNPITDKELADKIKKHIKHKGEVKFDVKRYESFNFVLYVPKNEDVEI